MLVSCILPTRDRPEYTRQAVQSFLTQTYSEKELIIVDDADRPSLMEVPTDSRIHYFREPQQPLGTKRNRCCFLSHGEIICHFDSDDWSEPTRIADQVQRLRQSGKRVTGYYSMLFFDEGGEPEWGYHELAPSYEALGTSLCYEKSYWEQEPFRNIPWLNLPCVGEDNDFVARAVQRNAWISDKGAGMMVARVHVKQTSPKTISDFRPYSSIIPPAFAAMLKPSS